MVFGRPGLLEKELRWIGTSERLDGSADLFDQLPV